MKKLLAVLLVFLATSFHSLPSLATANTTQVHVLAYSGTNVTTSAYVLLVASTPITVSKLVVCDTSGKLLKIASGAASSEKDLFTTFISGCVTIPTYLVKGTRLSIKAVDATASSGFNTVSFVE